jgi:hypothetical protein
MDPISQQSVEIKPRKVVRISRRKILYPLIGLIIVFLALAGYRIFLDVYGLKPTELRRSEIPTVAPYPSVGQPTINDTREFNKVSYSAEIKTQNVSDTVRAVKGAVREVEGRVDSENESEKYGSISFVVPKARFDAFRAEIESTTHEKFIIETVSSQNLLNQKQGIEQQINAATTTRANLEKQKKDLDTKHSQTLASINRELSSVQSQLVTVRQNLELTSDETQVYNLEIQEASLMTRENQLKQNRDAENRTYTNQNQHLTSQITYAQQNVTTTENRDAQFMDSIETVTGYVSVRWISVWDIAKIFSPIHPAWIITALVIIALFFLYKKEYIPKVEFV